MSSMSSDMSSVSSGSSSMTSMSSGLSNVSSGSSSMSSVSNWRKTVHGHNGLPAGLPKAPPLLLSLP